MSSCVIGHSDHSPTIGSSISAVCLGARIIEKHITLSHFVDGPDASVSLDPDEFKAMVNAVKLVRVTLGDSKIIQDKENIERQKRNNQKLSMAKDSDSVELEDMLDPNLPGYLDT